MTKHKLTIPNMGLVTSVVMSPEEFEELLIIVGELIANIIGDKTVDQVKLMREKGLVPLVARGTKTDRIFTKYEIETDKASFCVRGLAKRTFGITEDDMVHLQSGPDVDPAIRALDEIYELYSEEEKQKIEDLLEPILRDPLVGLGNYLGELAAEHNTFLPFVELLSRQTSGAFMYCMAQNSATFAAQPVLLRNYTRRLLVSLREACIRGHE